MMKMTGNDRGFTLLELLVAVSLLAVGLLATAAMQGISMNSNAIANKNSHVTAIGQEVLERVKSLKRDSPVLQTAGPPVIVNINLDPATVDISNDRSIPGFGVYRATYTVTPNTPEPNVSQIVIAIAQVNQDNSGFGLTWTPYRITFFKRVVAP